MVDKGYRCASITSLFYLLLKADASLNEGGQPSFEGGSYLSDRKVDCCLDS